MQPPAATLPGGRVAKNPIARPVACLDAVVIADQIRFAVAPPPFAVNALRPIGFGDAMARAAPDKKPRWMVGQFSDELKRTSDGWRFARRTFTILGTHTSAESS